MAEQPQPRERRVYKLVRTVETSPSGPESLVRQCQLHLRDLLCAQVSGMSKIGSDFAGCRDYFSCLPENVLKDLYACLFGIKVDLLGKGGAVLEQTSAIPEATSAHEKVSVLGSAQQLFLWRLFLDEDRTRVLNLPSLGLDRGFDLELVGFLAHHPTHLESITLNYNWIVQRDFEKLFQTQQHLRALKIGGITDNVFGMLNRNCPDLESLVFMTAPPRIKELSVIQFYREHTKISSVDFSQFDMKAPSNLQLGQMQKIVSALADLSHIKVISIRAPVLHSSMPVFPHARKLSCTFEHVPEKDLGHLLGTLEDKFPHLEELNLALVDVRSSGEINLKKLSPILRSLTVVSRSTQAIDFLNQFPNLRMLHVCEGNGSTAAQPPRFSEVECYPFLENLRVESKHYRRVEDLRDMLIKSPRLKRFKFHSYILTGLDENDILEALQASPDSLSRIETFSILVNRPMASIFTEKLFLEIIKRSESSINFIDNFLWTTESSRSTQETWKDIALLRGMRAVEATRSSNGGSTYWETEEGTPLHIHL